MSLIKSKSLNDIEYSEKNDVLYLGDRAEPGQPGSSLNNSTKSTVGKLSIRRRRKNHSHSSTLE